MRVFPPGLALDVGRGAAELAGARDLFVSHGHLDHALGAPFVLSQRTLHRAEGTRVFCPAAAAGNLRALIEAAARLEGVAYRYELRGLVPGERVEVGRDLLVEAFAVEHVVPSLGYHLVRRRRRLAAACRGLERAELLRRKAAGEAVEERYEELWLSYCGDTGVGVFELEPRVLESRVLVLECTFLGGEHRARGVAYGHLHLEDLAAREAAFANEAVVLIHLSRRFSAAELRRQVAALLPRLASRVHLLVEPE